MVNRTHVEHALYAGLMQLAVWVIAGDLLAGAAFGLAFFLGREHAQAQAKLGLGDFAAFDVRRWGWDARLDLLAPLVSVVTLYITVRYG